jgi:hypothetical protein
MDDGDPGSIPVFFYFGIKSGNSTANRNISHLSQRPSKKPLSLLPTHVAQSKKKLFRFFRFYSRKHTPPLVGEVECHQEFKRGKPRNVLELLVAASSLAWFTWPCTASEFVAYLHVEPGPPPGPRLAVKKNCFCSAWCRSPETSKTQSRARF